MRDRSSAIYSTNSKIKDAWYEGFEDCFMYEKKRVIKIYKDADSWKEFIKLVLHEFDIQEEDLKG